MNRLVVISLLFGFGCGSDSSSLLCEPPASAPTNDFFVNISKESGIQANGFVRLLTEHIPINDHSRLGFVDLNGDGFDDIVTHSLFPNPNAGIPFEHLIYMNNGDGTFTESSDASGLRHVQAAFFVFGDIDNDGDLDCFAGLDIPLSGETDRIFLNDGNGVFSEKENSGVETALGTSANAVFADFNGDAKLDLFVGHGGTTSGSNDALFFGNGDGTFSPETARLAGNRSMASNGSVTCDFDNDGDQDIFVSVYGVSNQLGHNLLWENDGQGNFVDSALAKDFHALPEGNYYLSDTHVPEPGVEPAQYVGSNGFGIDCKDVNNDGYMDIYLATISHPNAGTYSRKWSDPSQLLINLGPAQDYRFQNEFLARSLPFNEGDIDGSLVDFDNDGRLDIAVTRDKKYEENYSDIEQKAWFGLFRQTTDGSFQSLGTSSGINVLEPAASASAQECDMGQTCPSGETCLLNRCRKACTADDQCTNDEICGSWWREETLIQFCRSTLGMKSGQNHAWSDIDHDGDLDLLVGGRDVGGGRPNFLFRNDHGSQNTSIAIKLQGDGVAVNRDAIGARVMLTYGDGTILSREVQSSRGTYNSIDTRTLHFGLGEIGCDFSVQVRWPNGETSSIKTGSLSTSGINRITYPNSVD